MDRSSGRQRCDATISAEQLAVPVCQVPEAAHRCAAAIPVDFAEPPDSRAPFRPSEDLPMNFSDLRQLACAAIAAIAASHSALGQCPSDLNADGRTDGTDLSIVLAQWGTCASGSPCSADLNGDGLVNGTDLTALLAGRGPCPEPSCTGEYAWLPGFGAPGMSNTVAAVTVFDDGSGPALYVGGGFTTAGGVS